MSKIPLNKEEQAVTNLMFNYARSIDIMLEYLQRVFKSQQHHINSNLRWNFKLFLDFLHKAQLVFDRSFEPIFLEDTNVGKGAWKYDEFRKESNDLIQLGLYYLDRCSLDKGNRDKLFEFLKSLPVVEEQFVSDELLSNFHLK